MSGDVAFPDNDNLIWALGLTHQRTGELVESGIAWLTTVLDPDGNQVSGQSFPTTMFYTGANGNWVAVLNDTAALEDGKLYTAVVDVESTIGIVFHAEKPFLALKRTG